MANADNPNGFYPYGGSGIITTEETAAAQTIAVGDWVVLDAAGQVELATATTPKFYGVAASAVSASSAGDPINVYSDPLQKFIGQCSGTFARSMLDKEVDLEGTTGIQEINENAVLFQVLRIVAIQPDTEIGANSRVIVQAAKPQSGNFEGDFETLDVRGAATIGGTATVGALTDGVATLDGSGNWTAILALTATGAITGLSLTDGTLTSTAGTITGGVSITSTTFTDGTATLTGGDLTTTGTVSGGTITDGALSSTAGTVTGGVAATFSGQVSAGTLTDGALASTAGTVTGVVSLTATTITDGTATLTGGDITGAGSITATTLTDGALSTTAGTVTGAVSITSTTFTDGTATLTGGDITGAGSITATTFTDGALSCTGGTITGGVAATFSGTVTMGDCVQNGHKDAQWIQCTDFIFTNPTVEWGANSVGGMTLPASQTAKAFYVNLTGLKKGDELVGFYLVGDSDESGGDGNTLDAALNKIDAAAAETAVGAGNTMTQFTDNDNFNKADTETALSAPVAVVDDYRYAIKVLGTTVGGNDIDVQSCWVQVNRK
jgi:hypothetical protein